MVPSQIGTFKVSRTGKQRVRFIERLFGGLKPIFEEEWTTYESTYPYPKNKINEWATLEKTWHRIPYAKQFLGVIFNRPRCTLMDESDAV